MADRESPTPILSEFKRAFAGMFLVFGALVLPAGGMAIARSFDLNSTWTIVSAVCGLVPAVYLLAWRFRQRRAHLR